MQLDADQSPRTIRPERAFDGLVARRVEAVLKAGAAGARVRVDLSQVREFHDFALAVLAQALANTAAEVSVVGLRRDQFVVLGAFGVDTRRLEAALVPALG